MKTVLTALVLAAFNVLPAFAEEPAPNLTLAQLGEGSRVVVVENFEFPPNARSVVYQDGQHTATFLAPKYQGDNPDVVIGQKPEMKDALCAVGLNTEAVKPVRRILKPGRTAIIQSAYGGSSRIVSISFGSRFTADGKTRTDGDKTLALIMCQTSEKDGGMPTVADFNRQFGGKLRIELADPIEEGVTQ